MRYMKWISLWGMFIAGHILAILTFCGVNSFRIQSIAAAVGHLALIPLSAIVYTAIGPLTKVKAMVGNGKKVDLGRISPNWRGVIRVGDKKACDRDVGKFSADLGRFQIEMGNLIRRFKGAFFIAL